MPRPPTHFLALPLHTHAAFARSLSAFRADVTSPNSFAYPDAAIRPAGTLHLTLGVMHLADQSRVDAALGLLKATEPKKLLSSPLNIGFKGLEAMGSPEKTSVLYAPPVDAEGKLQAFCEDLKGRFVDAGFMEKDTRPLILHATVLNTIYVKGRGKAKGRLSIDARDVMARYEDFVWAEDLALGEVSLCKMGAQEVDGEVRYIAEGSESLID